MLKIIKILLLLSLLNVFLYGGEPDSSTEWVSPKKYSKMSPHPRLFVSQEQIDRMVKGRGEEFKETYETVAAAAETGVLDAEDPMRGMSSSDRSFKMSGRLISLAVQWHMTKDRRYIDAALKNIEGMRDWLQPNKEIILWEGQLIAAVAVAYDLLYNDLTPEERKRMVAFAHKHCISPFLRCSASHGSTLGGDGEFHAWWMDIASNWNPVCVSGAGMLALAMYEDIDEAQTVVDRVDKSIDSIIQELQVSKGGWMEGLGYWNWTMHYSFLFLMSYERSTSEDHKGFRSEGVKETMLFGQYFVPYDEACGFGDNQHGGISISQQAAAEHLHYTDVLKQQQLYEQRLEDAKSHKAELRGEKKTKVVASASPSKETAAEVPNINIIYEQPLKLLIAPDSVIKDFKLEPTKGKVHFYPKQGWGMIADQWPKPNIYASVRGGQLGGPHTHDDLLSYNAVIGIERMIHSINKAGYYDTSWEWRSKEIYERSQAAKNTVFIGGLSAYSGNVERRRYRGVASASMKSFELPSGPALRLDATRAFVLTRKNPRLVCRLFVALGDKGLLVLDRVDMPGRNPVEVRTHTEKQAEFEADSVLLTGSYEKARMTFASDQPAVLRRATALLTDARATPPTMMRWQTLGSESKVTMASLLTRGSDKVDLKVESDNKYITVHAAGDGWKETVRLTVTLEPDQNGK